MTISSSDISIGCDAIECEIGEHVDFHSMTNDLVTNSSITFSHIVAIANQAFHDLKNISHELFQKLEKQVIATKISASILVINKIYTDIEKIFNITGCIPGIGILSGSFRVILGKLQTITGIAIVATSELGQFLATRAGMDNLLINKWKILSQFGLEHILHGCLNVLRGTGEMLIGQYTMGLGNLPLIIPNLINGRNFNPYFSYGALTQYSDADK